MLQRNINNFQGIWFYAAYIMDYDFIMARFNFRKTLL